MTTIYGSTIAADVVPPLSFAQTECTLYKAEGKTDEETAIITGRSPRTVKAHITAARQKLHADNVTHLVAKAFLAEVLHKLPMLALCAVTVCNASISNALADDTDPQNDMMRISRTLRMPRARRSGRELDA